ncbi:DUF1657 domain-containing protein [Bacillus aquiflavi]|uniref:DUF1657 domain-containing protein n=1 Tax=Bacillus aquiflavi TaxID=2672567 RepID=A0A6B3W4J5_9BACI|nr:DUF1657 domain-containing protein [Bacillus aquiflavi]MBA4538550.1 DUF1657 domain-containing protein [Bacillus aquiflavi]NEY82913.1 DUF1657 domain-containing protein [Bacillus aquiflavi]UAC49589.1 DUF1657 domain-containing protein [Bacillus aquiflavi]
MTIASSLKSCIASLKGAEASFSKLAAITSCTDATRAFHECMLETREIVDDLQKRLAFLEREEPQYKGN